MLKYIVSLLAAFSLVACFKIKEATTLYPDGSGKMEFTFAMKKSMAALMSAGGEDPFEEFRDPDKLEEGFAGFVAWSKGRVSEEGAWKSYQMTGYFEDINAVRMLNDDMETGETEQMMGFELTKDEEGNHVLLVDNDMYRSLREDIGGEDESGEEAGDAELDGMQEMMEAMLEGMELEFSFTLPADILEAEGFLETEGRTASMKVTDEMLLHDDKPEIAEKMAKLDAAERGKIVWMGSAVTDEQMKAFEAELEAAKVEWKRIAAEYRAAKEKEAAEEGAGDQEE